MSRNKSLKFTRNIFLLYKLKYKILFDSLNFEIISSHANKYIDVNVVY